MSAEVAMGGTGGALTGAAAGAGIGLVAGPLGSAIGAGIGFLVGGGAGLFAGNMMTEERQRQEAESERVLKERRALAADSFNLAMQTQEQRVEGDDQSQITTLLETMKDPGLSLADKLAAFESQITTLGTDSQRIALQAKSIETQRENQQQDLNANLQTVRENIGQMQDQRDIAQGQSRNSAGALGVSGASLDASRGMARAQAETQLEQAARAAGYNLDVGNDRGMVPVTDFDQQLATAMAGENRYQTKLNQWYDQNVQGLELGATELFNQDAAYRANADLSRRGDELTNSQFEFQLNESRALNSNWLFGLVQGLNSGIGNAPTYFAAGKGFGDFGKSQGWWGSNGGSGKYSPSDWYKGRA